MSEDLKPPQPESVPDDLLELPEMAVNEPSEEGDGAVFVDEGERAVLMTEDETIVVEKPDPEVTVAAPVNRPRKVYTGMWGRPEIAAIAVASAAVLGMIGLFLFFVMPAERELEKNRVERNALEEELTSSRKKYGSITDTETQVSALLSSVDDFESTFLRIPENGQMALYQKINSLITDYGLVNTAGPTYEPLDIVDVERRRQQPAETERGRDKLASLFPGVYVTMTVEGTYQNLRRLIREIETSGQFIMISSVEFVPADTGGGTKKETEVATASGPPQAPAAAKPATVDRGKTLGETVSLKLEMAAYFSRPGRGATPAENPGASTAP